MKNILLVGNWKSDTGYAWWLMEAFWLAIAKKYEHACRVIVCYPEITTPPESLSQANINIVEFDFTGSHPLQVLSFLASNNIGYVYLTDRTYISWFYLFIRLVGVKKIIIHDHAPGVRNTPIGFKRLLKTLISRVPLLAADAYIAVSEKILERLIIVACLPRRKCSLAQNGIDIDKISDAMPVDIRKDLRLSDESILIVSTGRLTQYKGIHTIIAAADRLLRENRNLDIHFVHCGDGPDRATFEKEINDNALKNNFHLLGLRKDVAGILKSCDIAVHASKGEGLSLSILEFMAAGLSIVVSNDPSVSQSIENNISGLHFRTGDAKDLASKLHLLIGSPQTRLTLGTNAVEKVKTHYSIDQTINTILAIFEKTLPNKPIDN